MQVKAEIRKIFVDGGPLLAVAALMFDESFIVKNVRIVNGEKGVFIAMPSVRNKNNEYKNVCFPITKEARACIEQAVLDAYAAAASVKPVEIN